MNSLDKNFIAFESWYYSQIDFWKSKDIEVENTYYHDNELIHTYRIEIKSKNGFGEISLYESNNIYWVDFDACVDIDITFNVCNVTDKTTFYDAYKKFIDYLTTDSLK